VSTHAIDQVVGGGYSRSKAEAERLVAASGLETVVVRLPEVVGGGSREGVDRLLDAARAGRPLLVIGRGGHELRPVHVDDAVAAVAAAVDAPAAAGRIYTLGVPGVTFRELAEEARDAYGGRSRILSVPESLVALVCRASQLLPLPVVPDQLDRLRAPRPPASPEAEVDLGFRPRPLRDVVLSDRPAA
jgi:nucleoside-diphosphate-sugar epimerase